MKVLPFLLLLLVLSSFFPDFSLPSFSDSSYFDADFQVLSSQGGPRILLPVYVRLQALQRGSVSFRQSMPQNFSDRVATIDSRILAMFISSDSLSLNLTSDRVGNLWMVANYSLNVGDYISSLTWVSSRAVNENISSLGFVAFPESYPEDVGIYLDAGNKIQADDQIIRQIAAGYSQSPNMTQTVTDILDFVNKQGYDREKTRLLLSGDLNTTNILGFFKDALKVHETNSSICIERSWYAAAILRAAGVPTRTVTDVRLKTWIQVWLPNNGWVDAETLCADAPPHVGMFPKPISASVPWMIESSSSAAFPFTWSPEIRMRVANLTFGNVELFDTKEYRTVLAEPVDSELFKKDPVKFRFPIAFEPEIVYAAVTQEAGQLTFSLFRGDENASTPIILDENNDVALGDYVVSFTPSRNQAFLLLQDFEVRDLLRFDLLILVPVVAVPIVAAVIILLYWRRRRSRQ